MGIRISAFAWVPPVAQGLVRDLRVRWALEEAGLDYEERLLGLGDNASAAYLHLQPFGQVPAYEEEDLKLSSPAPSSCTSPSVARGCCRWTRSGVPAPRHGCLRRSTPLSRQ